MSNQAERELERIVNELEYDMIFQMSDEQWMDDRFEGCDDWDDEEETYNGVLEK